jgi:LmbE family N-acetylglucosaminyl deacetylase
MLNPVAIAIGAHPDDIEFGMAGTLLMLRRAGWTLHYVNLATGSCGSRRHRADRVRRLRRQEARAASRLLGARWHPPFVDDLEIVYELSLLRRLAAVLRTVRPGIILTHSPQDYMEDHTNTCRLAVTAAFSLGMPNFRTQPRRRAVDLDVVLYHAMPHGLRDGLRQRLAAGLYVNTTPVQDLKLRALAAHHSQQDWLRTSQGMNSYLRTMDDQSRALGRLSRRFQHAEGWRRHAHLGFAGADLDPLRSALGKDCAVNRSYERSLDDL